MLGIRILYPNIAIPPILSNPIAVANAPCPVHHQPPYLPQASGSVFADSPLSDSLPSDYCSCPRRLPYYPQPAGLLVVVASANSVASPLASPHGIMPGRPDMSNAEVGYVPSRTRSAFLPGTSLSQTRLPAPAPTISLWLISRAPRPSPCNSSHSAHAPAVGWVVPSTESSRIPERRTWSRTPRPARPPRSIIPNTGVLERPAIAGVPQAHFFLGFAHPGRMSPECVGRHKFRRLRCESCR